jgi:hypothetical protein
MRKKNCYDTFSEACLTNLRHPLPYGRYKLVECKVRLRQIVQELNRIEALVAGRGDKWSLEHCTSEDKHFWLKSVPNLVAWCLGYEVLPGLRALTGDGVPKAGIDAAYPSIEVEVKNLVSRLDSARQMIAKDIGYEYCRMRHAYPLLRPIVEDAVSLTEDALSVLGDAVQEVL